MDNEIIKIIVVGGGTAGLIAALTLKRKVPQLEITVVHSSEIGVIGVGESTTVLFPSHLHGYGCSRLGNIAFHLICVGFPSIV